MDDETSVSARLRRFAEVVGARSPALARRYQELAETVQDSEVVAGDAADVRAELLPSIWFANVGSPAKWGGIVAWVRDVLVLGPVLFTWYALSSASGAYRDLLAADAGQRSIPFLTLWQDGFGGRTLSFAAVARIDVLLILLLVALTGLVRWDEISLSRRDVAMAKLDAQAAPLLGDAWVTLHPSPEAAPVALLTRTNTLTQRLLREAEAQRESSADVGSQVAAQSEQVRLLSASLERLASSHSEVAATGRKLEDSSAQLVAQVGRLLTAVTEQQAGLSQTAERFGIAVGGMERAADVLDAYSTSVHSIAMDAHQIASEVRHLAGVVTGQWFGGNNSAIHNRANEDKVADAQVHASADAKSEESPPN